MFFSVIVPVYNVEKYLNKCLESLDEQTFKEFEIVLIDDGSTDNSGNICDDYAKIRDNVKVIHKQNEGLLIARRTGLVAAQGDYVIHCDSDDYIDKFLLENVHNFIQKYDVDMVMYGYDVVNDAGYVVENHSDVFQDNSVMKSSKDSVIYELVSTTWLNNIWSKATRRECIDIEADYSKYKHIKMGEDVFQLIPLVENCKSFGYIAKPLYKYRYNESGMSKNYTINYLYNYLETSNRLLDLCKKNGNENIIYAFFDRFEHDIYKYLLRFLYQGIEKKRYVILYEDIKKYKIVQEIKKYYKNMRFSNRILRFYVKPNFYIFKTLGVRLILKKLFS